MSALVELLEQRRFLSASAISAQFGAVPTFIAMQANYLPANATHDQAAVVSNVATIDWGDRSAKELVPVFGVELTLAQVFAPHTYQKPGVYKARVTFFEGTDVASRITQKIRVAQNSPGGQTLHTRTGHTLTAVYGTFHTTTAIDGAVIHFGDGTLGLGVVTKLDDNTYQITASHAYSKPGMYSVYIAGNDLLPRPGVYLGTKSPNVIPLYSSVRVTGPVVAPPAIPQVQLTNVIAPTIKFGDITDIATATGIPADQFEEVYITIDWSQGQTDGILSFNADGSADIKTEVPSTMTLTTLDFTLKVYFNDHVDATQNTLIGALTGSSQIDPGPTPGFFPGHHFIGGNPEPV